MLEKEHAFFESIKQELRKHHMDKFVVIVGEEQIGVFDSDQAAYEAGIKAKGNVPMLIKHVTPTDEEQRFEAPSLFLGLMHADS